MNFLPLRTAALLLALPLSSAFADQLLPGGSFENPRVTAPTPKLQGGDPSRVSGTWVRLDHKADAEGGKLVVGLSNEIARTGRQAIFVEFDALTAKLATSQLQSEFVSIVPGKKYHVSIWGRVHKKKPLTIDQRLPYLKVQVDFFEKDKETQAGEPVVKVQPMPGSKNRPAMFTATRWSEFYIDPEAPADAAFLRVTWKWDTTPEEGKTSGIMYFDDATVIGERGPDEPEPPEPTEPEGAEPKPAPAPAPAP